MTPPPSFSSALSAAAWTLADAADKPAKGGKEAKKDAKADAKKADPPQKDEPLGTVIGIDLGTTYSCVGVYKNGRVEIVANDQGNRITPSYVAFTDSERLIGDAAKNQATTNPERTVYDVKRLIGRKFADKEVQRDAKLVSYQIVDKDKKPYVQVTVGGDKKTFSPEEVSAMILTKMKETAEVGVGRGEGERERGWAARAPLDPHLAILLSSS